MECIAYTRPEPTDVVENGIPKVSTPRLAKLYAALDVPKGPTRRIVNVPSRGARHHISYSQTARNFVSVFKEAPPYLDEDTLAGLPPSKVGEVAVAMPDHVYASIAALMGELYFWYWLTRGDGFDVTGWIVSGFVKVLGVVPDEDLGMMVELGKVAHDRRYEALVFKKNAGKYVGNLNYRGHAWLTRRADLVLLAALGMDRDIADELFGNVQRVLGINQFAGEKSIPEAVKAKFHPKKPNEAVERELYLRTDRRIRRHFGFSDTELDFVLHRDVAYRPWGEGDNGD
jgi:hypothetical protein